VWFCPKILYLSVLFKNCGISGEVNKISKWINVNKKIPEHKETVDIWVVEEAEQGAYRIANAQFDIDCMDFVDDDGESYDILDEEADKKVTHWMPLPEPPEEEE